MFWSDYGYHCGEKDHWQETTLWEQASLAPMAIRVSGSAHAGKTCGRAVGSIDWYPTLVDYCRVEATTHKLEGQSLRPLLEDPEADWGRPALTTYGEGYTAVRDERFRHIRYPDGTEEPYDHDSDPHEWVNVAAAPEFDIVKQQLADAIPAQFAKSLGGRMG